MRSLLVALLFSAIAFAQQGESGRIEGRVVSTAGEPVAKASVHVYARVARGTTTTIYAEITTANGDFAVAGLPPGEYVVEARKEGYQTANAWPSLKVAAGTTRQVDVQLRQMLTVSGIVVEEGGDPVPNVTVSLRDPRIVRPFGNRQATTTDFGEFRLTDVAPGNYLVSIAPPADSSRGRVIEIRGASAQRQIQRTYYPGVASPAEATVIRIGTSITGLRLRPLHGPRYTVRVTVASLEPNTDSYVQLTSTRHNEDGSTSSGTSAGTVAIPSVPPGDYVAVVRAGSRIHGSVPVTVRDANVKVTIPKAEPRWPPIPTPLREPRMCTVWSTQPMPGRPSDWYSSTAFLGPDTPMEALPPGDYFAVAWEEFPPPEIVNEPAFLTRFAPLAARVTVEEGGRTSVQPNLIPREELRRVITEAPGK